MKPFEFLEPRNLEEACLLLSKYKGQAKLVAGGQSLVPLLKYRFISPQYLINIKDLREVDYIESDKNGIRIGALTTHRSVEKSPLIKKHFAVLAEMEDVLASVQVRNWGTIGGSISHADPAIDLGPVLLILEAEITARSVRGKRLIRIEEFFIDYLETKLEPDEILEEIFIPYLPPNTGSVYLKESPRFGDFPFVSVAARITLDREIIKDAKIALGAVDKKPIRSRKAEEAIIGEKISARLSNCGRHAAEEANPITDVTGSAEYKRDMIRIMTDSAVSQALKRASNNLSDRRPTR